MELCVSYEALLTVRLHVICMRWKYVKLVHNSVATRL